LARAVFSAPDISCGHCEMRISRAVRALSGVEGVQVDIPAKKVLVDYDPGVISPQAISEAIRSAGYPNQLAG